MFVWMLLGMPLSKIATHDQDGTRTCFADAAAVILDNWRFSQKPPVGDENFDLQTFPLDLAIQNASRHSGSDLHSGGTAAQVLMDAKEHGVCDPSKSMPLSPALSPELDEWLRAQVQHFEKCKEAASLYTASESSPSDPSQCPLKAAMSTDLIPDLRPLEVALGPKNTLDALMRTVDRICPDDKRQPVRGYKVVYQEFKDPKELGAAVDAQFSKPAPLQPMTIGFCANILEPGGENYSGVSWSKNHPSAAQNDCEKHEMVIIGEEVGPDGKCRVRAKGSWGGSCNEYSEKVKCEEGSGIVTIDEDDLAKNALESTHLEDEDKKQENKK